MVAVFDPGLCSVVGIHIHSVDTGRGSPGKSRANWTSHRDSCDTAAVDRRKGARAALRAAGHRYTGTPVSAPLPVLGMPGGPFHQNDTSTSRSNL